MSGQVRRGGYDWSQKLLCVIENTSDLDGCWLLLSLDDVRSLESGKMPCPLLPQSLKGHWEVLCDMTIRDLIVLW